jgi:imidazolonepropionase-like amidohydrolase
MGSTRDVFNMARKSLIERGDESYVAPSEDENPDEAANSLAIVGGTVIDGLGGSPIRHGVIVLDQGSVVAVGPPDEVCIPPGAQIISAEGRTVLPGVIDSHTHVETLRLFLADGVTSVGNTGSSPDLVATFHEKGRDSAVARGFIAGPALTAPGGYPSIRGDGSVARGVETIDEAVAAVDELVERGVDFIKLAQEPFDFNYQESGHLPVLAPDMIVAIVARATEHGLLVRSHVHYAYQLDIALDAGVTSIEHMLFPLPRDVGYVDLHRDHILTPSALPELQQRIERMVRHGVYLVPTIEGELTNIARGLPGFPSVALQAIEELLVTVLGIYVEAGGLVALGSDWVGIPGVPAGMPRHEMRYMQRAGMTPMQVIEASTRHAAAVCGQADTLGVLAPGRRADLIVVGGDPLYDLAALEAVQIVVKDGRVAFSAEETL